MVWFSISLHCSFWWFDFVELKKKYKLKAKWEISGERRSAAKGGVWNKEKWFKEVQLGQAELEGIRPRRVCHLLRKVQSWWESGAPALCPQVPPWVLGSMAREQFSLPLLPNGDKCYDPYLILLGVLEICNLN